jgi:hypothetical protein
MAEVKVEKASQTDWELARPKTSYKKKPSPWDAHREELQAGTMLKIHFNDDAERNTIVRGLGRTAAYWDPPMKLDYRYNEDAHLIVVRKSDEPYVRKTTTPSVSEPGPRRRGRPRKTPAAE